MLSLENITLEKLSVHFIGNKTREENFVLSKKAQSRFSEEEEQVLWRFFLSPFKNTSEFHRFSAEEENRPGSFRSLAAEIFSDPSSLHKISRKIAALLYEHSTHEKTDGGELYVAYLSGCILGDKVADAVGIFKSETKDLFIQAYHADEDYNLRFESGALVNKLDKACLIVNTGNDEEYTVCVTDSASKAPEDQYWKDSFLKITTCADDYHNTRNFMNVCKNFVTDKLAEDFEVTKSDKIGFLNKSVEYFKQNEKFSEAEFTREVFEDKNMIRSFREYKDAYQEENNLEIEEDFEISAPAVKKQAKVFKSVLKLDKNFHIYIHGPQDYIEKGTENDGRKFYKIYYSEES
jgi:hypothetical protein